MDDIQKLWLNFNKSSNKLASVLGRTRNIVGEYAEYIAHQHYGGKLFNVSDASADIKAKNGKLYQVKARKIRKTQSTQLSIIRSWDFDFLVVILFNADGTINKALELPVQVAKEYSKKNTHQNGWIITTSQKFLNENRSKDISKQLVKLNK